MRVPTRSDGTRSGVNWMRLKVPPTTDASVLIVSVFASPGTPSSSTWPPVSSATMTRSSIASCPMITRFISKSALSSASRGSSYAWLSLMEAKVRRETSPRDNALRLLWNGMRVLVAEDERRVADAVARGLRREGMAVDVAYDGSTAGRPGTPQRRARRTAGGARAPPPPHPATPPPPPPGGGGGHGPPGARH